MEFFISCLFISFSTLFSFSGFGRRRHLLDELLEPLLGPRHVLRKASKILQIALKASIYILDMLSMFTGYSLMSTLYIYIKICYAPHPLKYFEVTLHSL